VSVRIQTANYAIKESVFGVRCLVPSDDIVEACYELTALTEERDALARTLATLTEAGIVVGEDGAARWHGLTGAEIAALKELAAFGEQIILLFFRNRDLLAFGSTMQYDMLPELSRLLRQAGFRDSAALAAAVGRGAEGEIP
jgi:hypothetical protein